MGCLGSIECSMLHIHHVTKHFGGVAALSNVSIMVAPGEIVGLIGPNGSGKSTLVNILSGLLSVECGRAAWKYRALPLGDAPGVARQGITRTFQNARLFEQMTTLDNLLLMISPRDLTASFFTWGEQDRTRCAMEILESVGLSQKANTLAAQLSFGQRKLLEIARATATDAPVLLLDEPFAGLFPEMIKRVSELLRELRENERAIILIEHNMEIIRALCDRLYVLDAGHILAEGVPHEVLALPEVKEVYLGK